MSISTKHQELHATNAEESTSIKHSLSEKPQGSLQEQVNQVTSQSPSSNAADADTLIGSSNLKKFNPWSSYSGLQIYDDMEGDE